MNVLLVEDEREISSILEIYLLKAGFDTHIIEDGRDVVEWVNIHKPSIILLDLMLPGRNGLDICREIRSFSAVPIIITTAKIEEIDRLIGLELGADDYVCKPFSAKEVVARIVAILRRSSDFLDNSIKLNSDRLVVSANGNLVELTKVEYFLFELLYKSPGRIFSRQSILDAVYTDYRINSERTVDSHIRNLRRKLLCLGYQKDIIRSIYGMGYKFERL